MSESFVYELPIVTNPMEENQLFTRFNVARLIYNACLQEALRRLNLAKQSKLWQEGRNTPPGEKKSALFREALKLYHFSEYELHGYVKDLAKESWLKEHVDSTVAQKIASRAFQSTNEYRVGNRGKPRFKTIRQFSSVEGKSNVAGIRFKNGSIYWMGMVLKLIYDPCDEVEKHALHHKTKYVRLVRRIVREKVRYFAQLVLEGKPLIKKKHRVGTAIVGLDIGPSTLAAMSEESAFLIPLNPKAPKKQKKLQRALDRSLRKANPDNYNEKGTPKKNVKWKKSARYKKKSKKLAEEKRKEAGEITNQILSMGNTIKTEKLSYKSFQKQYGRSVARHAPGSMVQTLRLKAANAGGEVIEFSCYKTKLSQSCHNCNQIKKKALSERWHVCSCGINPVQRDLYSSFLAIHVEDEVLNRPKAVEAWACAEPLMKQALFKCEQAAKGKERFASFGFSQRQSCSPVKAGSMQDKAGDVVR